MAASRLFVRHGTHFAAAVEVHPDHADQVRMSFGDALSDFEVVDVSKGGIGLRSGVFFPKNLRVILTITGSGASGVPLGRSLVIRAVVRRCTMADHKPNYLVGLQFVDAAGRDEQQLVRLSAEPEGDKAAAPAGGGVDA